MRFSIDLRRTRPRSTPRSRPNIDEVNSGSQLGDPVWAPVRPAGWSCFAAPRSHQFIISSRFFARTEHTSGRPRVGRVRPQEQCTDPAGCPNAPRRVPQHRGEAPQGLHNRIHTTRTAFLPRRGRLDTAPPTGGGTSLHGKGSSTRQSSDGERLSATGRGRSPGSLHRCLACRASATPRRGSAVRQRPGPDTASLGQDGTSSECGCSDACSRRCAVTGRREAGRPRHHTASNRTTRRTTRSRRRSPTDHLHRLLDSG